jgi:hypothetical protein
MSIPTLIHEIQKMLVDNNLLNANDLDGKIGPKTKNGIDKFLDSKGISANKWSSARKLVAAEQLLYASQKIDVGIPDGLVGPSTTHAREVYNAKMVLNWRDKVDIVPVKSIPVKTSQKTSIVWPTQAECTKFYGKPGTNQVRCELPFTMVLAWDTKKKLNSYSCHKLVKEPMERIWNRTLEHYGYDKIVDLKLHYFGGCLNVRKMRGGSAWSMHSWGIAVDIDPDRNALRMNRKQATMSGAAYDKYWQFVYDEGAISLGKERDFDWMHWQFARL